MVWYGWIRLDGFLNVNVVKKVGHFHRGVEKVGDFLDMYTLEKVGHFQRFNLFS